MATGFKGDVERGTNKVSLSLNRFDGIHFCMRAAELLMMAFADDFAVFYDDSTYHGVGRDRSATKGSQPEGLGHELIIFFGHLLKEI